MQTVSRRPSQDTPDVQELVRVYQDLEKVLQGLKVRSNTDELPECSYRNINLEKLIARLSNSKQRIENALARVQKKAL